MLDREVCLNGWVHTIRDHGGVVFVDVRDRSGVVQVVFNPEQSREAHSLANDLRTEFVVAVRGVVRLRDEETVNPSLPTGTVEVPAVELEILNKSKTPPFDLDEEDLGDSIRLKYRYLDIRRPFMTRNLMFRHRCERHHSKLPWK